MSLYDQISEDIKKAMLAKDKVRLEALRGIKKEFIEAKTAKGATGVLEDAVALKILQKMVKQRKESAEIYQSKGRSELAENELAEAAVIEVYLPKAMSEEELRNALKEIIAETGASAPSDMGKVMGVATKRFAGRADGRMISEQVKLLLQ